MRRIRSKNVALIAAMAEQCITGKELAERCNVHPVTISAILNDRVEPSSATALAICRAIGATPEQLGFGEGDRS